MNDDDQVELSSCRATVSRNECRLEKSRKPKERVDLWRKVGELEEELIYFTGHRGQSRRGVDPTNGVYKLDESV